MSIAFLSAAPMRRSSLPRSRVVSPLRTRFQLSASASSPPKSRSFPERVMNAIPAIFLFFAGPSVGASSIAPLPYSSNSISQNVQVLHRRTVPTVLAAVNPPASLPSAPTFTIQDRLSFWMGEFLMWHPGARVVSLLALSLLSMFLGSFLYRLADPQQKEASSPFWHSVRAIANPLEDDWEKNSLRATSIALASIGMVFFAILIGMVTESVESAVRAADGAQSNVVISNHLLVCGWDSHVTQIVKDVASLTKNVPIVVLARPELKEEMTAQLRTALSDEENKRLRVFYRPGVPIVTEDLQRVAASRAKKIILVSEKQADATDADRLTISRAMALRLNLPTFTGDIVAEMHSERDGRILRSILKETGARSVETITAQKLLYRFMAQAIRQPGLADVVAQLMGDDARFVFHVRQAYEVAPHLMGLNFNETKPTSINGSILCGIVENGVAHIGLDKDIGITPSSELLVLGMNDGKHVESESVRVSRPMRAMMRAVNSSTKRNKKLAESYLICGWRPDMSDMLKELDNILVQGSKVTILDDNAPSKLVDSFENITVEVIAEKADKYENLELLINRKGNEFDHVVILGSAIGDHEKQRGPGMEKDSKTLASLAYVNELLSNQEKSGQGEKATIVTVEFLNERVSNMVKERGKIANAILPQNLSAKIAAQTVRESRLNCVWSELLSQTGREVYLRPCTMYKGVGESNESFENIADQIGESGDLVVGYVSADGHVVINPCGSEREEARTWSMEDMLIVLSEE